MVGFVDATPNNVDSLLEPYLECSFLKENYDLIKDNNDVLFNSYSVQQKAEKINGKRVTYKKPNDFIVEHFSNNISSLNFLFSAELSYNGNKKIKTSNHMKSFINWLLGYINQHGLKTTASVPKSTSSQTVEETDEETDDEDRTQDENNGTVNNTQSYSGGTPSSQSSHSTNKKSVLSNFKNGYQAPEPSRVYPTVFATSEPATWVDKQHYETVKIKVHETLQNTLLIKNELLKVTKKSNELKEKHLEIFQKQSDHSQQVIDILKSLCDSVKQLAQDVETIDDHLPMKRSRI
ncbi:hypothetical protein ACTFIZ_007929 [Dictyostelium cf. discoideum]